MLSTFSSFSFIFHEVSSSMAQSGGVCLPTPCSDGHPLAACDVVVIVCQLELRYLAR